MASRNTTPRKQHGEHEKQKFVYPFDSCYTGDIETDGYGCQIEVRGIPHLSDAVPVGDFSNNIKRWIWSAPGANDEEAWDGIFELEEQENEWDTHEEKDEKRKVNANGPRFAYFHAWCDYTGFDCQGGAFIVVARDIPTLIQFALGEYAYNRYMAGTEPADVW
jgi:hypothetical protein